MKTLVKNVLCLNDDGSLWNTNRIDVRIWDNKIIENGKELPAQEGEQIIFPVDGYLFRGLTDLRCFSGDFGYESAETIQSLAGAAKAGGFVNLGIHGYKEKAIQGIEDVFLLKEKGLKEGVNVLPYAAVSKDHKGEKFVELLDLFSHGAVGFSDGQTPIHNSDLLLKALQYSNSFGGVVNTISQDKYLSMFGLMAEGLTSTKLGLKGIPSVAETSYLQRAIEILRYAGGKLHISLISRAESLPIIRAAKMEGLQVSCDIGIGHLLFTENDLTSYDTNFKSNPPFGDIENQKGLLEGLKEGIIDFVVSNHYPVVIEEKEVEFDYALDGQIMLQQGLAMLMNKYSDLGLGFWVDKLSQKPKRLLNLIGGSLKENESDTFVVYDAAHTNVLTEKSSLSKSFNFPLWGEVVKGKVIAFI